MHNVIIVGAGLFGQAIGNELQRRGCIVAFFDDKRPENGTAPSGMLTKPSWYKGMGKDVYEPAIENLRANYSLQECSFDLGISKRGKVRVSGVYYVDPKEILCNEITPASVHSVSEDGTVHFMDASLQADIVIVAAGYWSSQLVPVPKMQGKKGVSFFWRVPKTYDATPNLIRLWAPYKHLVAHRRSPTEFWTGDGSAILPENWNESRVAECLARIRKHTGLPGDPFHTVQGIRPYVPGANPCYVKQLSSRLWVATGGAKNGLIAAGWAAWKISQQVGFTK